MKVDAELLARLVCPVTRAPLRYDEAAGELVSEAAGLAYPVQEGMPILLVEAARSTERPDDANGKSGPAMPHQLRRKSRSRLRPRNIWLV